VSLAALFTGIYQFNEQQKTSAVQMLDQQRQATLNGYIDDIAALALQHNLAKSKPGDLVRAIATARTLTAVRNLDGDRKGTLIRYLWEAGLIRGRHPVVELFHADLNGATFTSANLYQINLSPLGLSSAKLANAGLNGADLNGSVLIESDLSGADLNCFRPGSNSKLDACADLRGAYLMRASLAGADLRDANLAGADLKGTDLTGAKLSGADFRGAKYNSRPMQVTNAQGNPVTDQPTRWPQGFDPQAMGAICVDC